MLANICEWKKGISRKDSNHQDKVDVRVNISRSLHFGAIASDDNGDVVFLTAQNGL
jgi:hypothetical protein